MLGVIDGVEVGLILGVDVGLLLGTDDGSLDGEGLGTVDGLLLGVLVGTSVNTPGVLRHLLRALGYASRTNSPLVPVKVVQILGSQWRNC